MLKEIVLYKIEEVADVALKTRITDDILRGLPEWFGVEESIVEYVKNVQDKFFVAVYDGADIVGFLSVDVVNEFTIEIYVMGVKKEQHCKGIGRRLVDFAEKEFVEQGYKYFMVKTLGMSANYEYYDRTRQFYRSVGFLPLQEIKEIWGDENPCLIMVKVL